MSKLAIAYRMKKKMAKGGLLGTVEKLAPIAAMMMADGGDVQDDPPPPKADAIGDPVMRKKISDAFNKSLGFADGGDVAATFRGPPRSASNMKTGNTAVRPPSPHDEDDDGPDESYGPDIHDEEGDDVAQQYAEGGEVDDLVERAMRARAGCPEEYDAPEAHDDEDDDDDIVERAMRKRRK